MKLFASLYFDEDMNPLIAMLMRNRGFDVTVARDLKMLTTSDAEQLNFAVQGGRCLVMHNRSDFER